MTFKQKNNLLGWLIFAASLLVYVLTLEPTMSLWDCGEFLVSTCKLEISHAPGAPLFMLIGRVFSLLSFGHPERAAMMVNLVSALSSAGTVMLLFWTSVWLMKKIMPEHPGAVLLASAIGALSFAFTDSFWFSAVEAEVYALSSLFMALVLWAATRWEREADEPYANRWLLLIFFLTGLSIGVHLLNLLVIPSVALIIYFRKYTFSWKGFLLTASGSGALILLIMSVYIPGLFSLAGPLELFTVNSLHLPFNSGFFLYLVLLIAAFAFAVAYTHRKKKQLANLTVLCLLFLTLGYTSYLAVFIRSAANPPVDQGNPETTFELIDYLNRESYGTRPVLFGENFGSVAKNYEERTSYVTEGNHYVPIRLNPKVEYEPETTGFFPRMHSKEAGHMEAYKSWTNLEGRKVSYRDKNGQQHTTTIPTFEENLRFFLRYQFGHMYLRYFMWNFVGRQNDVQGYGGPLNGNWLSGIPFVDDYRLGSQQNLPSAQKENEGRNRYFFLPLILGLVGLLFHYRQGQKSFWSIMLLFVIMSIGLVGYLNEVPNTPRERDYVYVGSFYVFAIWIGMGALAVYRFFVSRINRKTTWILTALLTTTAGPGILLQQNYDDHDRSGRYTGRDLARNYLMSCEPNAILFTHADNDTYPLWYCQEVEGIRQDVRVVVMPYLSAGWYLKQINRKIYDNEGLNLTIPLSKYETGKVDYLPVVPRIHTEKEIEKVLEFVANDSSQTKVELQNGERIDFIPLTKMSIPIGTNHFSVELKKQYIMRNELAFWDIIASNIQNRPVCFTSIVDPRDYGLQDHLRFDGLVYKLIVDETPSDDITATGKIDTEVLYSNLMEKCTWDNQKDSSVYFDWHHRRMFAVTQMRHAFYRLADTLAKEKQFKKALEVIQEGEAILPFRLWPVDYYSCLMNKVYFSIGENEAGLKRLKEQVARLEEWLDYLEQSSSENNQLTEQERTTKLYFYRELWQMATQHDPKLAALMKDKFETYLANLPSAGQAG